MTDEETLRVVCVNEAALRRIDPALRFLRNGNTPADLRDLATETDETRTG